MKTSGSGEKNALKRRMIVLRKKARVVRR